MQNWKDRPEVQKGMIGEELVQKLMENHGWLCERPVTEAPHFVDFIFRDFSGKNLPLLGEVKTVAAFNWKNHLVTGFREKYISRYLNHSRNERKRLLMFFVDAKAAKIYGNFLDKLETPCEMSGQIFPITANINGVEMRLYSREQMFDMAALTEADVQKINEATAQIRKQRQKNIGAKIPMLEPPVAVIFKPTAVCRKIISPGGAGIEILRADKKIAPEHFVKLAQIYHALGFRSTPHADNSLPLEKNSEIFTQ